MKGKQEEETRGGYGFRIEGRRVKVIFEGGEVLGDCLLFGRNEIHLINAVYNDKRVNYVIVMKSKVQAILVDEKRVLT